LVAVEFTTIQQGTATSIKQL